MYLTITITLNDQAIKFSACELISLAQKVVHEAVVVDVPLSSDVIAPHLGRSKSEDQYPRSLIIPAHIPRLDSIEEWLGLAKKLSKEYQQTRLKGWWADMAGKLIHIRNEKEYRYFVNDYTDIEVIYSQTLGVVADAVPWSVLLSLSKEAVSNHGGGMKTDPGERRSHATEITRYVTNIVVPLHATLLNDDVGYQRLCNLWKNWKGLRSPEGHGKVELRIKQALLRSTIAKVNEGISEPLFKPVASYGGRKSAGPTYHEFAFSLASAHKDLICNPIANLGFASLMRSVLKGKSPRLLGGSFHFIPVLVAAWFIAEPARNPLSLLTGLMLLDLLESNVKCIEDGVNWYTLHNALIHPKKVSGALQVKDLYGSPRKIDSFGGCHPMAHCGSVQQTQNLPGAYLPLNVARQKEGHLIIHWIHEMILMSLPELKLKYHIGNVSTDSSVDPQKSRYYDDLVPKMRKGGEEVEKNGYIMRLEKKIKDCKASIARDVAKGSDVSSKEAKLDGLNNELSAAMAKKQIVECVILPMLRQRLAGLDHLLPAYSQKKAFKASARSQSPAFSTAHGVYASGRGGGVFVGYTEGAPAP